MRILRLFLLFVLECFIAISKNIALAQTIPPLPQSLSQAPKPRPSQITSRTPRKSYQKSDDLNWSDIKGINNFYGSTGAGWGLDILTKTAPQAPRDLSTGASGGDGPSAASEPQDGRYVVQLMGLIGWGPINWENLFFNTHYRYSQDWTIKFDQFQKFTNLWLSAGKHSGENFLFTTNAMLRTHEWASDIRYTSDGIQFGLFSRLLLARMASQILGSAGEKPETLALSENFVPYISFQYQNWYRVQLHMPFRTEINKDDVDLSNKSYSWSSKGRGRPVLSGTLKNSFYIEPIRSFIYTDLFYNDFVYNSIVNDKTRAGVAVSLDVPVGALDISWNNSFHCLPRFYYYTDKYFIQRVRVPDYIGSNIPSPQLYLRNDSVWGVGMNVYYSLLDSHRFTADASYENGTSSIREFNSSAQIYRLGYVYSWPNSTNVNKLSNRFPDSSFAEEF